MATLFHGTTLENWERIQAEGWNGPSRETVWECSLNEVYFHDAAKTDIYSDDDNDEEAFNRCISAAFSSAQCAAAGLNYLGSSLVVIKIEIDDELTDDDWSCENMSDIATVVRPEDIKPEHVKAVYRCDNYCPSLRLVYVCGLIDNYQFKQNFSDIEVKVMEHMRDMYIDELLEFDWYDVTPSAV
jgi:hypothetical protein